MKSLVLGGAGFIGYHIARMLAAEGHEVVICDNLFMGRMDTDLENLIRLPNVSFQLIDLTNIQNFDVLPSDVDVVFHLAAVNGTRLFYEIPYTVLRTNLLTTINVLDWLVGTKCKKLLWASSPEAYAGSVATDIASVPTGESVPLIITDVANPRFSYAGSKIAGELLNWNYATVNQCTVTIVRPHNIYGPRMGIDHVIPEFIVRILKEQDPFPMYGGDQTRAFCYVDDFVGGMLLAANIFADGSPRILNIGTDDEVIISDMASQLFGITGFNPTIDMRPSPLGSVHRRSPDISLARELLGYEPKVQLGEGLKRTYEWYVDHYNDIVDL